MSAPKVGRKIRISRKLCMGLRAGDSRVLRQENRWARAPGRLPDCARAMSRKDRVTSTDYAHPRRPLALRAYNRLAPRVDPEIAFDPDTLMAEAREATGLSDFGDPSFLPALRMLTR